MGNNLCATWQKPGYTFPFKSDPHLLRLWAEIYEVREKKDSQGKRPESEDMAQRSTDTGTHKKAYIETYWARVTEGLVPINISLHSSLQQTTFHLCAYNRFVEKIFDVFLRQPGTRLIQASDCFVHWRDVEKGKEWGLNFVNEVDAKRFRACCYNHTFLSLKNTDQTYSENPIEIYATSSKVNKLISNHNNNNNDKNINNSNNNNNNNNNMTNNMNNKLYCTLPPSNRKVDPSPNNRQTTSMYVEDNILPRQQQQQQQYHNSLNLRSYPKNCIYFNNENNGIYERQYVVKRCQRCSNVYQQQQLQNIQQQQHTSLNCVYGEINKNKDHKLCHQDQQLVRQQKQREDQLLLLLQQQQINQEQHNVNMQFNTQTHPQTHIQTHTQRLSWKPIQAEKDNYINDGIYMKVQEALNLPPNNHSTSSNGDNPETYHNLNHPPCAYDLSTTNRNALYQSSNISKQINIQNYIQKPTNQVKTFGNIHQENASTNDKHTLNSFSDRLNENENNNTHQFIHSQQTQNTEPTSRFNNYNYYIQHSINTSTLSSIQPLSTQAPSSSQPPSSSSPSSSQPSLIQPPSPYSSSSSKPPSSSSAPKSTKFNWPPPPPPPRKSVLSSEARQNNMRKNINDSNNMNNNKINNNINNNNNDNNNINNNNNNNHNGNNNNNNSVNANTPTNRPRKTTKSPTKMGCLLQTSSLSTFNNQPQQELVVNNVDTTKRQQASDADHNSSNTANSNSSGSIGKHNYSEANNDNNTKDTNNSREANNLDKFSHEENGKNSESENDQKINNNNNKLNNNNNNNGNNNKNINNNSNNNGKNNKEMKEIEKEGRKTENDESGDDSDTSDDGCHGNQRIQKLKSKSAVVRMQGFLSKKKWLVHKKEKLSLTTRKTWRKFWVQLKGNVLYFYENQSELQNPPKHKIVVEASLAQLHQHHTKKDLVFSLSTSYGNAYLLLTENAADTQKWIRNIHIGCAISMGRQHGKENTVKMLRNEVGRIEKKILMNTEMSSMASKRLESVQENKSRRAIEEQMRVWEEEVEALCTNKYRLLNYLASLLSSSPPDPVSLLCKMSGQTRCRLTHLNNHNTPHSSVACSFLHALVASRHSACRPVTDFPALHSAQEHYCPLGEFTENQTGRFLGAQTSTSPVYLKSSIIKVMLSDFQYVSVEVSDKSSVKDVVEALCGRLRLNSSDHFLLCHLYDGCKRICEKMVFILSLKNYEYLELKRKCLLQVEMDKGKQGGFGFKVEAELADEADQEDELCLFVSEVSRGGKAEEKGISLGDEILVLNGEVITNLDMVHIESVLHECDTLYVTIRSCKATLNEALFKSSIINSLTTNLNGTYDQIYNNNYNIYNNSNNNNYNYNIKNNKNAAKNVEASNESVCVVHNKQGDRFERRGRSLPAKSIHCLNSQHYTTCASHNASFRDATPTFKQRSTADNTQATSIMMKSVDGFEENQNTHKHTSPHRIFNTSQTSGSLSFHITSSNMDDFVCPPPPIIPPISNQLIHDLIIPEPNLEKSPENIPDLLRTRKPKTNGNTSNHSVRTSISTTNNVEQPCFSHEANENEFSNFNNLNYIEKLYKKSTETNSICQRQFEQAKVQNDIKTNINNYFISNNITIVNSSNTTNYNNDKKQKKNRCENKGVVVKDGLTITQVQHICKVVMELLETERHYVRDLKSLIERYLEPLKEEMVLSGKEIDQLFGNIRSIVQFQQMFLHSLEEAISFVPNFSAYLHNAEMIGAKSLQNMLFQTGLSFLYYAHHFKLYSSFCSSHSKAQKMISSEENTILKEFLRVRNPKQQHSSTIESLLIKPIQRILKYPLLLKQLVEATKPDSEEHKLLKDALHAMEAVAEHINEMQKIHEEYGSILEELTLSHHKHCLVTKKPFKSINLSVSDLQMYGTANWINYHDDVTKIKKDHELSSLVFVFKEAVALVAVERKSKKKKSRLSQYKNGGKGKSSASSGSSSTSAAVEAAGSNCKFKLLIPMSQLQVRSVVTENDQTAALWEVLYCRCEKEGRPQKTFQFVSSHRARRDFIKTIQQMMHVQFNNQPLPSSSYPSSLSSSSPHSTRLPRTMYEQQYMYHVYTKNQSNGSSCNNIRPSSQQPKNAQYNRQQQHNNKQFNNQQNYSSSQQNQQTHNQSNDQAIDQFLDQSKEALDTIQSPRPTFDNSSHTSTDDSNEHIYNVNNDIYDGNRTSDENFRELLITSCEYTSGLNLNNEVNSNHNDNINNEKIINNTTVNTVDSITNNSTINTDCKKDKINGKDNGKVDNVSSFKSSHISSNL